VAARAAILHDAKPHDASRRIELPALLDPRGNCRPISARPVPSSPATLQLFLPRSSIDVARRRIDRRRWGSQFRVTADKR
jgi:hypothetical protein